MIVSISSGDVDTPVFLVMFIVGVVPLYELVVWVVLKAVSVVIFVLLISDEDMVIGLVVGVIIVVGMVVVMAGVVVGVVVMEIGMVVVVMKMAVVVASTKSENMLN